MTLSYTRIVKSFRDCDKLNNASEKEHKCLMVDIALLAACKLIKHFIMRLIQIETPSHARCVVAFSSYSHVHLILPLVHGVFSCIEPHEGASGCVAEVFPLSFGVCACKCAHSAASIEQAFIRSVA